MLKTIENIFWGPGSPFYFAIILVLVYDLTKHGLMNEIMESVKISLMKGGAIEEYRRRRVKRMSNNEERVNRNGSFRTFKFVLLHY